MAVTLDDVGREAGVSRATASLVVRGSDRVAPETAERVRSAMDRLGYVYNRAAAGMRELRTRQVGLVATDVSNPFFAQATMAIESSLRAAGYTLLIGYSRDDAEQQRELLQTMVQRRADGILIHPALGTTPAELDAAAGGTPMVQFVRRASDTADFVGLNDRAAGEQVARHLLARGVSSVVYLGGSSRSTARTGRVAGLREVFSGGDVEFDDGGQWTSDNNLAGGIAAARRLLDAGRLPDAVVAHSDAVAFGVMGELRARELRPGRDVAVVGFDDVPLAAAQWPALTSVGTDDAELGARVADALLARFDGEGDPPRAVELAPALRIRASTTSWRRE